MKANFNILLFANLEQDRKDYGCKDLFIKNRTRLVLFFIIKSLIKYEWQRNLRLFCNNVLMIYIRYEDILHFYAGARSILHP